MRYFVTGVTGQLGSEVASELLLRGHEVFGTGRKAEAPDLLFGRDKFTYISFDLSNTDALRASFGKVLPDVVIHCASWTAVDDAEKAENREAVRTINAESTGILAELCKNSSAKMLYISTDYVFAGEGTEPYESDSTAFAPLNHYGATKLEGETAVRNVLDKHFVVRVSWTFGKYGDNFIEKMIRASKGRDSVKVVDDQFGTPTYTVDAARAIADIAASEEYGTYNLTASGGYVSRAEFAGEIFKAEGINVKIVPVKTSDFNSPAKRPLNSRLDSSKLEAHGFHALPDWRDGLKRYLAER